jgi:hypothetical protein
MTRSVSINVLKTGYLFRIDPVWNLPRAAHEACSMRRMRPFPPPLRDRSELVPIPAGSGFETRGAATVGDAPNGSCVDAGWPAWQRTDKRTTWLKSGDASVQRVRASLWCTGRHADRSSGRAPAQISLQLGGESVESSRQLSGESVESSRVELEHWIAAAGRS